MSGKLETHFRNFIMLATVTDKGQVTLPKAIRDLLGIRPGSRIDFQVTADKTLSARVLTRGSEGLFGLLHRPGQRTITIEEMDDAIAAEVAERSAPKR